MVFAVPVVGVRFINTAPVLIDPDLYQKRNEVRTNTDLNGYEDLVAALNLLPNKPPLKTISDGGNTSIIIPPIDSVAHRLKIARLDDDPVLLKFLDDCDPAFELVSVALQKTILLYPFPPVVHWQFSPTYHKADFLPLVTAMASVAQSKILRQNKPEEGLELLARLYALHSRMVPEIEPSAGTLSKEILDATKDIALALEAPEDMRLMLTMLLNTEPVYSRPEEILDRWYNLIDNGIMFPQSGYMRQGVMNFETRMAIWQFQRAAKFLVDDENDMSRLLELPSSAFIEWTQDRNLDSFNFMNSVEHYMLSSIISGLLWARYFEDTYLATEILVAAKLYKLEHDVFPETLDDLAPEYLPEIPLNSVSDEAFYYENKGDYIQIATDGYTSVSFWGEVSPPQRHYYLDFKDFPAQDAAAHPDQAK